MINIKTLLSDENKIKCYQVQGIENNNEVNIKYMGEYDHIPLDVITKFDLEQYNCEIVSFLLSEEEIKNDKYLKMISCLFFIQNKIVMSLDFTYSKQTEFPFNIILNRKKEEKIIKSFETFVGNTNIVNILIEQIENIEFTIHNIL